MTGTPALRAATGRGRRAVLRKGEVIVRIGSDAALKLQLGPKYPALIEHVRDVEHYGWGIRQAGFDSENICRVLLGMPPAGERPPAQPKNPAANQED